MQDKRRQASDPLLNVIENRRQYINENEDVDENVDENEDENVDE